MKPQATLFASLFCALVGATVAASARGANPAGSGGDAGTDAADDAGTDADVPPDGIQPTTTPDNLGCTMHAIGSEHESGGRAAPSGAVPGQLVIAAGALAMAIGRRRATRRRSS
jgi:hypothetical protein